MAEQTVRQVPLGPQDIDDLIFSGQSGPYISQR